MHIIVFCCFLVGPLLPCVASELMFEQNKHDDVDDDDYDDDDDVLIHL